MRRLHTNLLLLTVKLSFCRSWSFIADDVTAGLINTPYSLFSGKFFTLQSTRLVFFQMFLGRYSESSPSDLNFKVKQSVSCPSSQHIFQEQIINISSKVHLLQVCLPSTAASLPSSSYVKASGLQTGSSPWLVLGCQEGEAYH